MPVLPNEVLLILSVIVFFSMTVACFALFGEKGLTSWTVIATIAANIEVMVLIDAFGMTQTLGNVMFASTFLTTDIISEVYGKKQAKAAVNIGILTSVCFIIISQSWLLFTPNGDDWAFPNISAIFGNTPRIMITGLVVYAIVQRLDVFLYHKWWEFTTKKIGNSRRFLWLRNGSTIISQLINTVLFTLGAFYGVYEAGELVTIAAASFSIYIFTTIADTPFIYLARFLRDKNIAGKLL